MNVSNNEEPKYSSIQYFFWLLSGAEISVLKECPTDYNRQAGIGFTIFMTTLLAFCSGGYAGYYFGDSLWAAIIFGIIWAALIFSIDRSMVVTLKKDPTQPKQKVLVPLLSRSILAILIAFVISIPLELLIFSENIESGMKDFKLDMTNKTQLKSRRNEALTDKQLILSNDSLNLSKVEGLLGAGEPQSDPTYDLLKTEANTLSKQMGEAQKNLKAAENEESRAYSAIPVDEYGQKLRSGSAYETYLNKKERVKKLQPIYFEARNSFNKAENDRTTYLKEWIAELRTEQKNYSDNIKESRNSINQSLKNTEQVKKEAEDLYGKQKGFILKFMVLESLAVTDDPDRPEGKTIFLMLWLVRIIFILIEILPTIAKISTPVGAYDWAIYHKEQQLRFALEQKMEEYLENQRRIRTIEYEAQQRQVKERTDIENQLKKDILKDIALVQNDIAKKKVQEFKEKHLST